MIQLSPADSSRILIDLKINYLNTVAMVCMTWWVSSVVFIGSGIAALWHYREKIELTKQQWDRFFWLGCIFLGSVIAFGIVVLVYLSRLSSSINRNLRLLQLPPDSFNLEIGTFRYAMAAGTSTFVLILFVWLQLRGIRLGKARKTTAAVGD